MPLSYYTSFESQLSYAWSLFLSLITLSLGYGWVPSSSETQLLAHFLGASFCLLARIGDDLDKLLCRKIDRILNSVFTCYDILSCVGSCPNNRGEFASYGIVSIGGVADNEPHR